MIECVNITAKIALPTGDRPQSWFDIATGEKLAGEMDADDEIKVKAWISIHREDLFANWELLTTQGTFFKIEPLR